MQHRTALMKIFGSTGMLLGKWADNDQRLMFDNTKKNASGLEIKRSEEDPKKLELCWSSQEDRLRFVTKSSSQARIRKQAILSKVAHIFDPLGLGTDQDCRSCDSPSEATHEKRERNLSWDEDLLQDLHIQWYAFRPDLNALSTISSL